MHTLLFNIIYNAVENVYIIKSTKKESLKLYTRIRDTLTISLESILSYTFLFKYLANLFKCEKEII